MTDTTSLFDKKLVVLRVSLYELHFYKNKRVVRKLLSFIYFLRIHNGNDN